VFGLTVDIDHQFADFAQQPQADGPSVDARRAASLAPYLSAQDDHPGLVAQSLTIEQGLGRLAGGTAQKKSSLHQRRFRALAHGRGIGPSSQDKLHGVDDDRLAGAGLAGEYDEAVRQRQLELGDDGEIADAEGSAASGDQSRSFPTPGVRAMSITTLGSP
jgi:hypothetical protein